MLKKSLFTMLLATLVISMLSPDLWGRSSYPEIVDKGGPKKDLQQQSNDDLSASMYTIPEDDRQPVTIRVTDQTKYLYLPKGSIYRYNSNNDLILQDGIFRWTKQSNYYTALYDVTGKQLTDYNNWSWSLFDNGASVFSYSDPKTNKKRYGILYKNQTYKELSDKYFKISDFVDGIAVAEYTKTVNYTQTYNVVFLNAEGKEVYPALNYSAKTSFYGMPGVYPRPLQEGLRAYYDFDKKRYGYIDASGKIVIQPQFYEAENFSEGLAAVVVKQEGSLNYWGYIDKTGKLVIPAKFESLSYGRTPSNFGNGYSVVQNEDNKLYYIDNTGKRASDLYDYATPFTEGYAMVMQQSRAEKQITVIDTKFQEVRKIDKYEYLYGNPVFVNGLAKVHYAGGASYVITPDGRTVIKGTDMNTFIGGFTKEGYSYCRVTLDKVEHVGIINTSGEFVLLFTHNSDFDKEGEVVPLKKIETK